jgi:hypothetical protein
VHVSQGFGAFSAAQIQYCIYHFTNSAVIILQGYAMETHFDPDLGLNRKVCTPKPPLPGWAIGLISALAPLAGVLLLVLVLVFSNHAWHQVRFKPK